MKKLIFLSLFLTIGLMAQSDVKIRILNSDGSGGGGGSATNVNFGAGKFLMITTNGAASWTGDVDTNGLFGWFDTVFLTSVSSNNISGQINPSQIYPAISSGVNTNGFLSLSDMRGILSTGEVAYAADFGTNSFDRQWTRNAATGSVANAAVASNLVQFATLSNVSRLYILSQTTNPGSPSSLGGDIILPVGSTIHSLGDVDFSNPILMFQPYYNEGDFYLSGFPTNGVDGHYVREMETNAPDFSPLDIITYTNINGLFRYWFSGSECIFAVDDSNLLPKSIGFPPTTSDSDCAHFTTNTIFSWHNDVAGFGNGSQIHYVTTGVLSGSIPIAQAAKGTNYLKIRLDPFYAGIRDEVAVPIPLSIVMSQVYSNGAGNLYIEGEAFLQSTNNHAAEVDLVFIERLQTDFVEINWMTNTYHYIKGAGIVASDTVEVHRCLPPHSLFYFTNRSTAPALAYATNCLTHN